MRRDRDYIDAEFEVVGDHYRPGEQHRDRRLRRWFFTGLRDAYGHPLWYRRPRLNRLQFFLALCVAVGLAWCGFVALAYLLF